MVISSGTSGEHAAFCQVCGKLSMVEPCWPLADATCPSCGSLVFVKYLESPKDHPTGIRSACSEILEPADPVAEAQAAAWSDPVFEPVDAAAQAQEAELYQLWEEHKNRRAQELAGATKLSAK